MKLNQLKIICCNEEMTSPESGNVLGGTYSYFSQKNPLLDRNNQDSLGILSSEDTALLLVADGIGGHRMGDEASKIAVTTIIENCKNIKSLTIDDVYQAILKANSKIRALNVGAGTTLCLGLIHKNKLTFLSTGDSLGIHISGKGNTKTKTLDQSSAGLANLSDLFTPQEVAKKEGGNQLAFALGDESINLCITGPVEISQRDIIVIASDGLTANLSEDDISQIITNGPVNERVLQLIENARAKMTQTCGHPDDLTVVLLSFGRLDSTGTTGKEEKEV